MKMLITAEDIKKRILELAASIELRYKQNEEIILAPVLVGGIHFASDLSRTLKQPHQILPICASSYQGKKEAQTKFPRVTLHEGSIRDKHVLIVDDIRDRGTTLAVIEKMLKWEEPKSITTCVLLAKAVPTEYHPNYVGFHINNYFVVGYGLDFEGRFRHLPYVGILEDGD